MTTRERWAWICLTMGIGVQGCAQVLGYEEPFVLEEDPACMPVDDNNDCTIDTCNAAGMTIHTLQAEGTVCTTNGGSKCNATGVCVQCLAVSDCPGTDDDCQQRTCIAGQCSKNFTPAELALPTQTAGDCHKTVCDGNGTSKDNVDDTDKPNDNTLCTTDSCMNGTLVFTPVALGTMCTDGNGTTCNSVGQCRFDIGVMCAMASDCANSNCVDGVCCSASACDLGGSCATGDCTCPGTTPMACSGVCKDLAVDDENCGACGQPCTTDATGVHACSGGSCINRSWTAWPMPNPVGTGLPNTANYTVDSAKGLVTDNVTKLMWQQNIDAGSYTSGTAKAYCADLVYGGYSDWRLPTRIELVSLIDSTKSDPLPTIDTMTFPNTPRDYFWASSTLAGNASTGWYVNFDDGSTSFRDGMLPSRVRCVR